VHLPPPSAAALAQAQEVPKPTETSRPRVTLADFGLAYPLSNDWVRATELLRKRVAFESSPRNFDVLLAAVYVPKANLSKASPFFSLFAFRQPATDCRKNLESIAARSPDKYEGGITEFAAAGREYIRANERTVKGRHQFTICTTANGHLLFWNGGAPNEKGLEAIVATLDAITALPPRNEGEPARSAGKDRGADDTSPEPGPATPERVRVASGVTSGLLIKKVHPFYPEDARAAHLDGTVVLRAEISTNGDVTDLELLDGPIELAGSAVFAVRQWKYKPYLLNGKPVAVLTQVQVKYELFPY